MREVVLPTRRTGRAVFDSRPSPSSQPRRRRRRCRPPVLSAIYRSDMTKRMDATVTVDLFLSVDGFAGSDGLPGYFGYFGPDLGSWIATESAAAHTVLMGRR